jgi:type VI secretion system secreted protein VgrG
MTLNVTLSFADHPHGSIPGLVVHRYEVRDALCELFDVQLTLASTDLSLDMQAVVGQPVTVGFGDEPFLTQMTGIVRLCRQLTGVLQAGSDAGAALYEIEVVPRHWLLTRRSDHRIFQHQSVPQIVDAVLASLGGRLPASAKKLTSTYAPREYCVQYGETDYDFIARILAEEKIAWFFDHADQSAFTLCDDTSTTTRKLPEAIPFAAAPTLDAGAPHVFNVLVSSRIETSAVILRDYDYENPRLKLEGKHTIFAAELFANEADLNAYSYEVGRFRSISQGDTGAELDLDARRALSRTFSCEASFGLPPGTRVSLSGHPRPEPNSGLLVVRTRILIDDGSGVSGSDGQGARARRLLECIDERAPFFQERRLKPRISGTQTAFVIGDTPEGTVEVDAMGRVKLAFRWDRRDPTSGAPTRRVRVSQGWAGNGFGLVTLPRVGDEVVVAYADGDPDEPLVIGRVHNATVVTPLLLPDKDKALAVWRSRSFSSSGPGPGFNQILMDDTQGGERLELHAERDFKSDTGRNAATTVGVDQSTTVGGDSTSRIAGAYSLRSGSTSISTGPYTLNADSIDETAKKHINTTTNQRVDESQFHAIHAIGIYLSGDGAVSLSSGGSDLQIEPGFIKLSSGASSIKITPEGISISGPVVDVKGAPIKLNC